MILVTDGASNCGESEDVLERFQTYDENLPTVVSDAYQDLGIPTYVVGIDIQETSTYPATEPRARLNELAALGGVPQADAANAFYDAQNGVELAAALDKIAAAVSCTVEVQQPEGYVGIEGIQIGQSMLTERQSCDEGDGFVASFDGLTYTIEFCGSACEAFVAEDGLADVGFACPPVG